MAAQQGSLLKTGLALGLLSAIGPLAIDLYLPAFPTMVRDLHATPGEVQRTLSGFFLALASLAGALLHAARSKANVRDDLSAKTDGGRMPLCPSSRSRTASRCRI